MSVISLTIPDAVVSRVLDATCTRYKWDGTGTKAQFVKKWFIDRIIYEVKMYEGELSIRNAQKTVDADVDSKIVIT